MRLCGIGIAVGLVGTIVTAADDGVSAFSDQGSERTYAVSNFDGVASVGSADVVVSVGPAFSARGSGDPKALDRYEVTVEGGVLKIQPKQSGWWGLPWSSSGDATFNVTLPQISSASLVGSGAMKIDKVQGPKFAANVTGSGEMTVAGLAVNEAELALAGSGDLSASGKAANTRVSLSGSGDLDGSALTSGNADISLRGSGDAALAVENTANVAIVGSGDVSVSGTAHCKISRQGSGDVSCPS